MLNATACLQVSGPSIESAYLSGSLLADSLADRFKSGTKKDFGLDPKERFQVYPSLSPSLSLSLSACELSHLTVLLLKSLWALSMKLPIYF